MYEFTSQDLLQLEAMGISPEKASQQLDSFQTGFPPLDIIAPASGKQGILVPTKAQVQHYVDLWQEYLKEDHKIVKFVPASGAASRMFKDLFAYAEDGVETPFITTFLENLDRFAFATELKQLVLTKDANGLSNGQLIVKTLLEDMKYGSLPKGLLLFHSYKDGARTPVLEHMVEGALYAASNQMVRLHFTVSHEHLPFFRKHVGDFLQPYEHKYGVRYDISFSEQKKSTDTIAANPDGTPFRQANGALLFRPGGHGALIENLSDIDADIVFVKNIDNVVPDSLKKDTVKSKQLLAGVLGEEQKRVFERLQDSSISEQERQLLNRPIRVCGVVPNTGEPGGGAFLVREEDGTISKQILESTQVHDPELMTQATHFNPVDLVCAIKDYEGNPFALTDFVDPNTGFISHKSKDGKELLALELPGLWNGAMAKWNTIFVQVPITTFNPVKTVNDLLREQHQ